MSTTAGFDAPLLAVHEALGAVCRNSEPATYGHECGKPATWLGARSGNIHPGQPFVMAFCSDCRDRGWEAKSIARWERICAEVLA